MSSADVGARVRTTAEQGGGTTVPERHGLSFGGLLRSEWIKLWSLRSTYWCFGIAVALTVGFGLLVASAVASSSDHTSATAALAEAATAGTSVAELVVAVLGALVVAGEYGTGMIRTTFLAAPRRVDALAAKALTFGLVAFALGILSVAVSTAIAASIFLAAGLHPDLADGGLWAALLGGAGAIALVGLLAVGVGMLVKNTAAAITLTVGLLFVLPIILSIVGAVTRADWFTNAVGYLPSQAASRMASLAPHAAAMLDPWQAALVLAAWVVVFLGIGLFVAERRDA